jgi:hypothetical protein
MSHLKGIALESDEVHLEKPLERLRQMSNEELIKFGKQVPALVSAPRIGVANDPWPVLSFAKLNPLRLEMPLRPRQTASLIGTWTASPERANIGATIYRKTAPDTLKLGVS